MSAAVVSAVATVATTALLTAAVRLLTGLRRDTKRFMAEHLWLLATADWSQQTISSLMHELGITSPPPPPRHGGK